MLEIKKTEKQAYNYLILQISFSSTRNKEKTILEILESTFLVVSDRNRFQFRFTCRLKTKLKI